MMFGYKRAFVGETLFKPYHSCMYAVATSNQNVYQQCVLATEKCTD